MLVARSLRKLMSNCVKMLAPLRFGSLDNETRLPKRSPDNSQRVYQGTHWNETSNLFLLREPDMQEWRHERTINAEVSSGSSMKPELGRRVREKTDGCASPISVLYNLVPDEIIVDSMSLTKLSHLSLWCFPKNVQYRNCNESLDEKKSFTLQID